MNRPWEMPTGDFFALKVAEVANRNPQVQQMLRIRRNQKQLMMIARARGDIAETQRYHDLQLRTKMQTYKMVNR